MELHFLGGLSGTAASSCSSGDISWVYLQLTCIFSFFSLGGGEYSFGHFDGPTEHYLGIATACVVLLECIYLNRVNAVFVGEIFGAEEAIGTFEQISCHLCPLLFSILDYSDEIVKIDPDVGER